VSQAALAFHAALNQHSPCHSIGWQKRTQERGSGRERERERESEREGGRKRRREAEGEGRRERKEKEKREKEKRRTIVLAARGDRRVSAFSNARRLARSMARSDPAALFLPRAQWRRICGAECEARDFFSRYFN